jgi:hypothetical protein
MNKILDVAAFMKQILARVAFMSKIFAVAATIDKMKRLEYIFSQRNCSQSVE